MLSNLDALRLKAEGELVIIAQDGKDAEAELKRREALRANLQPTKLTRDAWTLLHEIQSSVTLLVAATPLMHRCVARMPGEARYRRYLAAMEELLSNGLVRHHPGPLEDDREVGEDPSLVFPPELHNGEYSLTPEGAKGTWRMA